MNSAICTAAYQEELRELLDPKMGCPIEKYNLFVAAMQRTEMSAPELATWAGRGGQDTTYRSIRQLTEYGCAALKLGHISKRVVQQVVQFDRTEHQRLVQHIARKRMGEGAALSYLMKEYKSPDSVKRGSMHLTGPWPIKNPNIDEYTASLALTPVPTVEPVPAAAAAAAAEEEELSEEWASSTTRLRDEGCPPPGMRLPDAPAPRSITLSAPVRQNDYPPTPAVEKIVTRHVAVAGATELGRSNLEAQLAAAQRGEPSPEMAAAAYASAQQIVDLLVVVARGILQIKAVSLDCILRATSDKMNHDRIANLLRHISDDTTFLEATFNTASQQHRHG